MKCPVCGSTKIEFDALRGEYYCKDCGYVLEDVVFYIDGYYNQRVNTKKKTRRDYYKSKQIGKKIKRIENRYKKQKKVEDKVYNKMERIFSRFNVSEVERMEAKRLLGNVLKDKEMRKYASYVGLHIVKYILDRKGIMMTLEMIAEMGDVPKSRLKLFKRVWRMMYSKGYFKKRNTVYDYLLYGFRQLDIPMEFMDDAFNIWFEIDGKTNGYSRKVSPRIFASIIIVLLNKKYNFGLKLSQISRVMGVSDVWIRNRVKKLKKDGIIL